MKKAFIILMLILNISLYSISYNYNNNYTDGTTSDGSLAYMNICKVYSVSIKGDQIFADIGKREPGNNRKMFHFPNSEKELYALLLLAKASDSDVTVYFQLSHNQKPFTWYGEKAYHSLWSATMN